MAILTILGLYRWDRRLFDGLALPPDVVRFKDDIVHTIVEECAELELVFPDFDYMKESIYTWSSLNVARWEKLYKTTAFEYDPISNYDRTETWTDTGTGSGKVAGFDSGTLVDSSSATSSSSHTGRMYGNIGVTTTQEMIESERKVNMWNFFQVIVNEFKTKYCLLVY